VAPRLGYLKPALIHCKFFPPLQGRGGKMSGSLANTAVYVTDTAKQVRTVQCSAVQEGGSNRIFCPWRLQIKDKINKHAFSGGRETLELQVHLGHHCYHSAACR
jgi:tryptophanyl-tRNA synthetase